MGEKAGRKTINVDYLARVEGEGGMTVVVEDGAVIDVALRIYEPPRFFEAFLRERDFREAPDITARICGICPVAYQMSAVHAMERACGVKVEGALRELRRLLYCGEWIESHVLHVYMLHAPDFLGYAGAVEMAADYPDVVKRALRMKKIGNRIVQVLGGREIHPINVKVGGFYRAPRRAELLELVDELRWAKDAAVETVRLVAGFPMPEFQREYQFVALRHDSEYPFNEGRLVSNRGLDIAIEQYEQHFREIHVAHSNALHSQLADGSNYFVGPMARFALNFDRLPGFIQELSAEVGLQPSCRNPFQSIVVRAIETLYAIDEAVRIIEAYQPPEQPAVDVQPLSDVEGWGCTEAPRGILYHRYNVAPDGAIKDARIIPPTSQNQPTIEEDLRGFVEAHLELDDEALTWQCEQAIRNYDPCISCATHFLKLTIEGR